MQITIDTNIFVEACDPSCTTSHYENACAILSYIKDEGHQLVLDYAGEIRKEYEDNLKGKDMGHGKYLFDRIVNYGGQIILHDSSLDQKIKDLIDPMKFDLSDRKFLGVCLSSSCKKVVSIDGKSFHSDAFCDDIVPKIMRNPKYKKFENIHLNDWKSKLK